MVSKLMKKYNGIKFPLEIMNRHTWCGHQSE